MGNYEQLKQAVSDVIKTNGNKEITGAIMQNTLLSIISTVGSNATFAGIATPETNPGTPDQNAFYLASQPGIYSNFGGVELTDQVIIFINKEGNWKKLNSGIALNKIVAEIANRTIIIGDYSPIENKDTLQSGSLAIIYFDKLIKAGTEIVVKITANHDMYSRSAYICYKQGTINDGYDTIFEKNDTIKLGQEYYYKYTTQNDGYLMINGNVSVGNMLVAAYSNSIIEQIKEIDKSVKKNTEDIGKIDNDVKELSLYKDIIEEKILEFGGAGINKFCFFDRQLKKGTKMIITLSPNPQANIVNTYLVHKNGSLDNGYEAIEENILDLTTEKMIEYITKSDGFLMVNGNATSGNKLGIKYQIGIQDKIENNTSDLTINNYYQEPIENKTLSFTGAGQNNFLFFDKIIPKGTNILIKILPDGGSINVLSAYITYTQGIINDGYDKIFEGVNEVKSDYIFNYITQHDGYLMVNGNAANGKTINVSYYLSISDYIKINNDIKYIDGVGDSLTMGWEATGSYLNKLQDLLEDNYIVRNWGVGGEQISSIMVRMGATSLVYPNSFELPKDGTEVEVARKTGETGFKCSFNNTGVPLLLQGNNSMVNPCFVEGHECTLTRKSIDPQQPAYLSSNSYWTLKLNKQADRNIQVSKYSSLLCNTAKQIANGYARIIWMGTNGDYNDNLQELVNANKMAVESSVTKRVIVIGLHLLGKENGESYEKMMYKEFGNKFFNIRQYCITNLIYDAGITPTEQDLEDMKNGVCPQSVMIDGTHFNPQSNDAIGTRIYNLMVSLGYV
jgi:hypothetical protein